ncbi:hypothetical protein ACFQ0M_05940 [Kitasatospora aburaviensis]
MTSALTIGFAAPEQGGLRGDAVVADGARQFSLLAVENGYLLPTVILEPEGYQGNLTAHLPAGLEVADEDGAPCPAALAAALRAVWAPADPTRLTVTGRRVLVSGASLPLEVVHPGPWDPADPPGEPLVVVVSWKVGYSGALAPGAAHAAVQLTFLPPGVSPRPHRTWSRPCWSCATPAPGDAGCGASRAGWSRWTSAPPPPPRRWSTPR